MVRDDEAMQSIVEGGTGRRWVTSRPGSPFGIANFGDSGAREARGPRILAIDGAFEARRSRPQAIARSVSASKTCTPASLTASSSVCPADVFAASSPSRRATKGLSPTIPCA